MVAPVISLNGRWGGKLRDQNLELVSGDEATLEVTVTNIDGTAKSLTGAAVSWAMSRRSGSEAKISKTGTVTNAVGGILQIPVDGTGEFSGEYYHEAQVIDGGGTIGTIMRGHVTLDPDTV